MNDNIIKEISKLLLKKSPEGNKGTNGTLSVIAGSECYRGAARLAVSSALSCGVGIVRLVSVEKVIASVSSAIPECIFLPISANSEGGISASYLSDKLPYVCKRSNAVLVGCGMGDTDDTRDIVSSVIKAFEGQIILDADGLNSIKNIKDILLSARKRPIITPHIGEMSRLTGLSVSEIKENRIKIAEGFTEKYNCTVVLKDYMTVVASEGEETFILDRPNAGLAKGGSGDVLAGIIASLSAQGYDGFSAARLGVMLHSLAAEAAKEELSEYSMLPSDIISRFPAVFKKILSVREKENKLNENNDSL